MLAAASTVDALDAAVDEYRDATAEAVRVSYGPTSTLARQIEAGAPAELFLSANASWARRVVDTGGVREERVLALNRLVVVAPAGTDVPGPTDGDRARELLLDWSRDPDLRLALADPDAVPAGMYARQALESLELWSLLEPLLIPTVDVRAALALAARAEVDGAFVYATDAGSSDRVRVALQLDPSLHDRLVYPWLLLEPARPAAERLWRWLLSEDGRRHFEERGFLLPDDAGADDDPEPRRAMNPTHPER